MDDDSLTLRDYLIALQNGTVEEFETAVLDLLEPMVKSDYDGWGDVALRNWYQAMLNHLVPGKRAGWPNGSDKDGRAGCRRGSIDAEEK